LTLGEGLISNISRWENGHRQPDGFHRQVLFRIYRPLTAEASDSGSLLLSPFVIMPGAADRPGSDMNRREFLRHAAQTVGAAALAPALGSADPDASDRLSTALRRPSQVDAAAVEDLEKVTAAHRRMYHSFTSFELIGVVVGHLRTVLLLLQGAQPLTLHRRLAEIGGEAAGYVAWLAFDLNHHQARDRYYTLAVDLATEAGDPALTGYVQGFQSIVQHEDGNQHVALELVRGAIDRSERSATPTIKAWLAGLEAQVQAEIDDPVSCLRALGRAETALEQARLEEDPPWMYEFDRARLAAQQGACLSRLGQPEKAQAALRGALAIIDPSCVHRRAEILADLAFTHVQQEDLQEACRLAGESLSMSVDAASRVGVNRIRQLRPRLDRWKDARPVIELDERLAYAG
jgi:tetratricopeptide (TPR) repeat protein